MKAIILEIWNYSERDFFFGINFPLSNREKKTREK